jgi:murein L,D-transpeptidase YafK
MMSIRVALRFSFVAAAAVLLAGCPFSGGGDGSIHPAMKQLSPETQTLLAKAGMTQEAPVFVRIFKEESQLEIWKQKSDGHYYLFKTYPICSWSGGLGPKVKVGDKQAPEGFYTVTPGQMNPNSQFHLAFNVGFPNAYDKANGRTGDALMVHGDCRSAGCYAMTDALIEEIYALAREAFRGGQSKFHVHAFPFRMTAENMLRHRSSPWYGFWKTLKVGYDDFELTRMVPKVNVCSRNYLVNADFLGHEAVPDGAESCPAYQHARLTPFAPGGNANPTLLAKAPPAVTGTTPGTTPSRVASYSAPPAQAPVLAAARPEPAPAAAPAAKPAPVAPRPAALSSQGVLTGPANAAPAQAQPKPEEQPRAISLAGAITTAPSLPRPQVQDQLQPVSATMQQPVADAQQEPEKKDDQQPVTRGLHNVVESGKGDMIMPSQPR